MEFKPGDKVRLKHTKDVFIIYKRCDCTTCKKPGALPGYFVDNGNLYNVTELELTEKKLMSETDYLDAFQRNFEDGV